MITFILSHLDGFKDYHDNINSVDKEVSMTFIRDEGRIYAGDALHPDAYILYEYDDENVIKATSTVVDPSLRGQGIAKLLLDELALLAREKGLKIIPVCSYVVTAFKRYDEYKDVMNDA